MALVLDAQAQAQCLPVADRTLTTLPDDILHLLLQSLHNFTALRALLLTSPIFPTLLAQNPTTIYTQIAGRHFAASSFTLLDLWRPTGLTPFQRRYVTERTLGLISGDGFGLCADRKVVGYAEVERMVADRQVIGKLVEWVIGVMAEGEQVGVEKVLSAEAASGTGIVEIPVFKVEREVSAAEKERVHDAIVALLALLPSIHSKALAASDYVHEVPQQTLFDASRALFDYTPVLSTSTLATHLQMLAVADILAPSLPFFADMQNWLKTLLWDRAIDLSRLFSDEQWEMASLVEYVRAGALADKWQEELKEFCLVASPARKGFVNGLNWAGYQKREVTTQDREGRMARAVVLVNLELDG